MDLKLIIGDSAIIKVAVVDATGRPFDMLDAKLYAAGLYYLANNTIDRISVIDVEEKSTLIFPISTWFDWPLPGIYPYCIEVQDGVAQRYTLAEGNIEFRERMK
jgi:hypothetical protein